MASRSKRKERSRQRERALHAVIAVGAVAFFAALLLMGLVDEASLSRYGPLMAGVLFFVAWGGNLVLNAVDHGVVSFVFVGEVRRESNPVGYWCCWLVLLLPALGLLALGICRAASA